MFARSVVITEGLIGELLRSGPYQECQRIARQLCPPKHHVYTLAIFPTHRNTRCSTQHARNQRSPSPSSLIPDQRRWSNRMHVRGKRTPSSVRARPTPPAYYRVRQRAMRVTVRSGRSTGTGPSRAARRGRRAAAGRCAAVQVLRDHVDAQPRCPRGICMRASQGTSY